MLHLICESYYISCCITLSCSGLNKMSVHLNKSHCCDNIFVLLLLKGRSRGQERRGDIHHWTASWFVSFTGWFTRWFIGWFIGWFTGWFIARFVSPFLHLFIHDTVLSHMEGSLICNPIACCLDACKSPTSYLPSIYLCDLSVRMGSWDGVVQSWNLIPWLVFPLCLQK